MNYRIVETDSELPDVLLYRDRNDDSDEIVKIHAMGIIDNESDMFAIEEVVFPNKELAQSFIKLFTTDLAIAFCQRNNIGYEY